MFENEPEGATPIEAEEAEDLIPQHIQSRDQLNTWEQENILYASAWAQTIRESILDDVKIKELHRRMFDRTWKWAGQYRKTNKNIGIEWMSVPTDVRNLILDAKYWLENETYSIDESAARLHHRLVSIHPFPNGNGRHARLWCDTLLQQCGRPPFEWKNADLDQKTDARKAYIAALRAADNNDYSLLFKLLLTEKR